MVATCASAARPSWPEHGQTSPFVITESQASSRASAPATLDSLPAGTRSRRPARAGSNRRRPRRTTGTETLADSTSTTFDPVLGQLRDLLCGDGHIPLVPRLSPPPCSGRSQERLLSSSLRVSSVKDANGPVDPYWAVPRSRNRHWSYDWPSAPTLAQSVSLHEAVVAAWRWQPGWVDPLTAGLSHAS